MGGPEILCCNRSKKKKEYATVAKTFSFFLSLSLPLSFKNIEQHDGRAKLYLNFVLQC
jgi:hypothetical protein